MMALNGLPDELLKKIFFFSEEREADPKTGIKTLCMFAKKLVLVCRRWKDIIFDDGRFWRIFLYLAYAAPDPTSDIRDQMRCGLIAIIDNLKKHLDGSGQSDIKIEIHNLGGREEATSREEKLIIEAFSLLAPRSHQIRSIFLNCRSEKLLLLAATLNKFRALPRLGSIRLQASDGKSVLEPLDAGEEHIIDLCHARELENLSISAINLLGVIIPPSGLRTLNLRSISSKQNPIAWRILHKFITSCPSLRAIVFMYSPVDFLLRPGTSGRRDLEDLEDASLDLDLLSYSEIFQAFRADGLTTLCVRFRPIGDVFASVGVLNGNFPRFPKLKTLQVEIDEWTAPMELALRSAMPPSLTDLSITYGLDLRIQSPLLLASPRLSLPHALRALRATFSGRQPEWIPILSRLDFSGIEQLTVRRLGSLQESILSPTRTGHVDFPSVHHLALEDFNSGESEYFSNAIRAPGLTTLRHKITAPNSFDRSPFPRHFSSAELPLHPPPPIYRNLTTVQITVMESTDLENPLLLFPQARDFTLGLAARNGVLGPGATANLMSLSDGLNILPKLWQLKLIILPWAKWGGPGPEDRDVTGEKCKILLCSALLTRGKQGRPIQDVGLYISGLNSADEMHLFWATGSE